MVENLLSQPLGSLGPTNFLKHAVFLAIKSGISWEIVVVLLLFPLVAAFLAAARYFIGLRGFGIFTPAMMAVVFLTTGVVPGVLLFLIILAAATLARLITRGLKIHYLARMALLLWFVSLTVFGMLFWFKASLFPILILILLAENFIEVQIGRSIQDAFRMTLETFILALVSFWLLSWQWLQKAVLSYPELVVFGTMVLDLLIGRFTGLRLLEYRRFRRLLK